MCIVQRLGECIIALCHTQFPFPRIACMSPSQVPGTLHALAQDVCCVTCNVPDTQAPLYAWVGAQGHSGRALLGTASVGSVLQGSLACDARATQASTFALHPYRHIQTLSSASAGRECMCAYTPCLSMCLDPILLSAPFSTLVKTASPCSTSGISYERATLTA